MSTEGQDKTNEMSFLFHLRQPPGIRTSIIGRLGGFGTQIVEKRSQRNKIKNTASMAIMTIHGILHLRGYDP